MDKKNKNIEFEETTEILETDIKSTLESMEAYDHLLEQVPEDERENVLAEVKELTDGWQVFIDGIKEVFNDPVAKAEFKKLASEKMKKRG